MADAEQRGAVIDLDRGIGFRAAGERQGIVIGDAIARRAAVGRERGNRRGDRGTGVDGDAERTRGRAGIAGHIGGGGGQAVGAVGKRGRRIGPIAAAIGGGAAEQRGAVIDLDGGIGFRAAGQRQGIVIGDVSPTMPLSVEYAAIAGVTGALASTVTLSALEAALVLPATSVAAAVRLWAPLASAAVVKLQAPAPLAVADPSSVAPS